MPIRPENKKLYPKNWAKIRSNILARAEYCCEFCFLRNYELGIRDEGYFYGLTSTHKQGQFYGGRKVIKIVLTIAHLDHDPTNNDYSNLKALCQQCHNRYDARHRAENRKRNKQKCSD